MTNAQPKKRKSARHNRVLSSANIFSLIAAVSIFLLGVAVWDTNIGIGVSAVGAGVTSGVIWWLLTRRSTGESLESSLEHIALLGAIPVDSSGPAPTLSHDGATDTYTQLLRELEGRTTGRILLVMSPSPGQGASTVALNLAVAASKAGRRVLLVDADPSRSGLSRFLSTGRSPGLSEIAAGTATLSEAARMWTLDGGTQFPMVPTGENLSEATGLAGGTIAEALATVSERADLILVDVPPIKWSSATPQLSVHADGAILVLADSADPSGVTAAIRGLADANAPVVGYVRNQSTGKRRLKPIWWRRALIHAAVTSLLLAAVFATYTSAQLWYSWNRVEVQAFDISAIAQIEVAPSAVADDIELPPGVPPPAETPPTTAPEEAYETFLIIGGDEVSGAADVIMYLVRPTNNAPPFMVSLPRDLYVANACTGGNSRINALIYGCEHKNINGPSLLSYTVGRFTGIEVDHFALFDFDGFERIIDAVGGVEICVEHSVRDRQSRLSLSAGCTQATGEQALAWVRSRHTQHLIGGSWKSVPGAGDLLRNQYQQDIILELFRELKSFDSPTELTAQVASLADAFTLDSTLSLTSAVSLAWEMRSVDLSNLKRLEIPVRMTRTSDGQSILIATVPFDQVMMDAYGGALPNDDAPSQQSTAMAE